MDLELDKFVNCLELRRCTILMARLCKGHVRQGASKVSMPLIYPSGIDIHNCGKDINECNNAVGIESKIVNDVGPTLT